MVVEVDGSGRRCGVVHKGLEVVGRHVGLVDEAVGVGVASASTHNRGVGRNGGLHLDGGLFVAGARDGVIPRRR